MKILLVLQTGTGIGLLLELYFNNSMKQKARDAYFYASRVQSVSVNPNPRFECIPAMCYNLRIVTESLGYSLRLSVIWRLCT